jgi:hypothetical protein
MEVSSMFHVPKKNFMGCAIATAAMMSQMSYEEVAAKCGGASPADLRWAKKLRKLLEVVTETKWVIGFHLWPFPVKSLSWPEWPVALFIQDSQWWCRFGQWIVVKGGLIYDPAYPKTLPMREYPLRNWFVNHLIKPKQPAQLRKIGQQRRFERVLEELSDQVADLKNFKAPSEWLIPKK